LLQLVKKIGVKYTVYLFTSKKQKVFNIIFFKLIAINGNNKIIYVKIYLPKA